MDYDDQLRLSCAKTGDLLHRRPKGDENDDADDEFIDDFEAEMEDELDDIMLTAQSKWSKNEKVENNEQKPSTSKENELYDKGR